MKNIENLGQLRQKAHPHGTKRYYKDENVEDSIGIAGEIKFAERYNLKPDLKIRPNGDGHIDFEIVVNEITPITIDVKTAQKAYNLLVKKWEIEKCSDILVLAQFHPDKSVGFLGWTTKKKMKTMPIKIFSSLNIENYYMPVRDLEDMAVLDKMFKTCTVKQIIRD